MEIKSLIFCSHAFICDVVMCTFLYKNMVVSVHTKDTVCFNMIHVFNVCVCFNVCHKLRMYLHYVHLLQSWKNSPHSCSYKYYTIWYRFYFFGFFYPCQYRTAALVTAVEMHAGWVSLLWFLSLCTNGMFQQKCIARNVPEECSL